MEYPKFIIENDNLILGKVQFHKHLTTKPNEVKGGGWYEFDHERKTFTFYGESFDFGSARLDDIKKCIELKNVFDTRRNIFEKHNFAYRDSTGEITILKQE